MKTRFLCSLAFALATFAHAANPGAAPNLGVHNPAVYTTRIDGVANAGFVGDEVITDSVTDGFGNLYVVGTFTSSDLKVDVMGDVDSDSTGRFEVKKFTLLENSFDGNRDIFIIKYDRNGNVVWAKSAGGDGDDHVSGVAVDRSGNAFISGSFRDRPARFGPNTLTLGVAQGGATANFGVTAGLFVAALDRDGAWLFAKQLDYGFKVREYAGTNDPLQPVNVLVSGGTAVSSSKQSVHCVAVDAGGSIYVQGQCGLNIDVDPPTNFGGRIAYMNFSNVGEIAVATAVRSSQEPGGTLTSISSAFIAKLENVALPNQAAEYQWKWVVPITLSLRNGRTVDPSGPGFSEVTALKVDDTNNLFAAGTWSGAIQVGTTQHIAAPDTQSAFVVRLITGNGAPSYVSRIDSPSSINSPGFILPRGIAFDTARNAYLTGSFYKSNAVKFTPAAGAPAEIKLDNSAVADTTPGPGGFSTFATGFLAKLGPDGVWQWAEQFGGSGSTRSLDVARDSAGALYVTGAVDAVSGSNGHQIGTFPMTLGGNIKPGDAFVAKLTEGPNNTRSWVWLQRTAGSAINVGTAKSNSQFQGAKLSVGTTGALYWTLNTFPAVGGSTGLFLDPLVPIDAANSSSYFVLAKRSPDVVGIDYAKDAVRRSGGFIIPLDYDGQFLPTFSDVRYVLAGEEVKPPSGVYTVDGKPLQPEIVVNGNTDPSFNTSPYFFWSIFEGKLYAVSPCVAEVKWKVNADPLSPARLIGNVVVQWPADVQKHVVATDQPLVKLEPTGSSVTFSRVAYSESGAAVVGNKTLQTTREGYSTLIYTQGVNKTEGSGPAKLQIIRTYYWDNLAVFEPQGGDVPIGVPLDSGAAGHVDASGDNGFVVHKKARYDGFGPTAVHHRETRKGLIIPVNEDEPDSTDDDLVVIWYLTNTDHVVWPFAAVKYKAVWPANPARIVISSQRGSELPGQVELTPDKFQNMSVYSQPSKSEPGYNPNEEHGLVAPSPLSENAVVFALRNDLNNYPGTLLTSKPYTLLKYQDATNGGAWAFKVYQVLVTAPGFPDFTNFFVIPPGGTLTPAEAGKRVLAPYPLSLFGPHPNTTGGGDAYFKDHHGDVWARSAGEIEARYWYPLQAAFWWDLDGNGVQDNATGAPWLHINTTVTPRTVGEPVTVKYLATWPDLPAELPLGTTLLDGNDGVAGTPGVPAVRNWAAGRIIFDENEPKLGHSVPAIAAEANAANAMVRMFDPLSPRRAPIVATPVTAEALKFGTATLNVALEPDGTYRFTDLSAHLGTRLRYHKTANALEFRGFESNNFNGEPLFLINVMTIGERNELFQFDGGNESNSGSVWDTAVSNLFTKSRDPNGVGGTGINVGLAKDGTQIVQETVLGPKAITAGLGTGIGFVTLVENDDPSLGDAPVALHVIRVTLPQERGFVRLIKQSDVLKERVELRHSADFGGNTDGLFFEWHLQPATSVTPPPNPDESSGWLKVAEGYGLNQIAIKGSGLATLGDQWAFCRYRGFRVALPSVKEKSGIVCAAAQNLGGKSFIIGGATSPVVVCFIVSGGSNPLPPLPPNGRRLLIPLGSAWLADEVALNLASYLNQDPDFYAAATGSKVIVEADLAGARLDIADTDSGLLVERLTDGVTGEVLLSENTWSPWAGDAGAAAADRARIVPGWIKRVLEGIDPFEQRVKDFRAETLTYSSLVQAAGGPFEGAVAFSGSADNLNSVGLIPLYSTVLNRGLDLSINAINAQTNSAVNDALLLASSRVADLYMVLGNEAYSDAQDPTVGFTSDGDVTQAAPPPDAFAFQNQLPSLMSEELALLRGRDDSAGGVGASPVYNRLNWNFTSGLEGEPLYVQTYAIGDQNANGLIGPDDAKVQFPQGHGDAWGHYLSASTLYYRLLRHPRYTWKPRPENTTVLGVGVQVDYLDEQKFARLAAAKARTGCEIVDLTYRNSYVANPAGQWQGYKDSEPSRAWGVDEWARRAGQGALFDWVVANALLPETYDPSTVPRDPVLYPDFQYTEPSLQKIDRTTIAELREIGSAFTEIQSLVDAADRGLNPLGLDNNATPFDIDPTFDEVGSGQQGHTHFEQVRDRALQALQNATSVWEYANGFTQRLRKVQQSADDFAQIVLEEELGYKNQLIEIFGYPYVGDIGPGKAYSPGYNGPDLIKYMYISVNDLEGNQTATVTEFPAYFLPLGFEAVQNPAGTFSTATGFTFPDGIPPTTATQLVVQFPVTEKSLTGSQWQFLATPEMGARRAEGQLQGVARSMIVAQAEVVRAKKDYDSLIAEIKGQLGLLAARYNVNAANLNLRNNTLDTTVGLNATLGILQANSLTIANVGSFTEEFTEAVADSIPKTLGLAYDIFGGVRLSTKTAGQIIGGALMSSKVVTDVAANSIDLAKETIELTNDIEIDKNNQDFEVTEHLRSLESLIRSEVPKRIELFQLQQQLIAAAESYNTLLAQGERIMEQRLVFRRKVAGSVQNNRYQDITFRNFRNAALAKYRAAFDLAARYTFVTAKAYDYETNLLGPASGSGREFLTDLVRHRSLGQFIDGQPINGVAGLSDPMARMSQNYDVLKGQLGFNNPNFETARLSLRYEAFRIPEYAPPEEAPAGETLAEKDKRMERNDASKQSNNDWATLLKGTLPGGGCRYVQDLSVLPEFRRFCRPFAPEGTTQPGLVIEFTSKIEHGLNFFVQQLGSGDHAYDPSQFSTKIRSASVFFEGYDELGLAAAPRVYLVPVGSDFMYSPTGDTLQAREFRVVDQRIPTPFKIGASNLINPNFIPQNDTLNGSFAEIRRHSGMRAYDATVGDDEISPDSRLIGRSVWNSRWMLIIPGATLLNDPDEGLKTFVEGVKDIQIFFKTYSYSGN